MIRRLTSSGTRSSKQRLPASMWKTGIPSRFATIGGEPAVRVAEDEQAVGALLASSASTAAMILADLRAEGRLRGPRGSGRAARTPSSLEEDVAEPRIVVLPGVDEHVVAERVELRRSRARGG